MKTIKYLVCLVGVAGGLFAAMAADEPAATNSTVTNSAAAPADANQTPQPPADTAAAPDTAAPQPAQSAAPAQASAPAAVVPAPTTAAQNLEATSSVDFASGKGLVLNFRDVPLEMVLNYLSQAAGFVINVNRGVDVAGKVNVWSAQPLSKEEAVQLLEKILNQSGYTVVQDKRILTIMSTAQAKSNEGTPVDLVTDYKQIPRDTATVTEVIPVHTLNPVQLVKDLKDLLPPDTTIVANDSANAVLMTDTRANIRRIANIIETLDSVSSGVNTLRVFSLKYADAKSVADMVKEDSFPRQMQTGMAAGRSAPALAGVAAAAAAFLAALVFPVPAVTTAVATTRAMGKLRRPTSAPWRMNTAIP